MGTKNKPGRFDCYANAEPDEPMFVLLARDPLAPILVKLWAELKRVANDDADDTVHEAEQCAADMTAWCRKNRPGKQLIITRS